MNVFAVYMYGILLGLWGPQSSMCHNLLNKLQHSLLVWAPFNWCRFVVSLIMKDQVECLSEACTVSGMQEGTFLGDGIYKGSMFSFLTAKGISNMIYPHSSNKLYLASNRLNLVRYFQLFLLVEVRWYSQGYWCGCFLLANQ